MFQAHGAAGPVCAGVTASLLVPAALPHGDQGGQAAALKRCQKR